MKKVLNLSMSLILMMDLTKMSQTAFASSMDENTSVNLDNFNCDKKNLTNPLTCMACQVYFESRGEAYEGQLAVAKVTLKRANNNTRYVCDKVFEKKRGVCQFSWACDDNDHRMTDKKAVKMAIKVAKQAFKEGPDRYDHFYANYIAKPVWAVSMSCKTKGRHIFCDGTDVAGYKKVPARVIASSQEQYAGL